MHMQQSTFKLVAKPHPEATAADVLMNAGLAVLLVWRPQSFNQDSLMMPGHSVCHP